MHLLLAVALVASVGTNEILMEAEDAELQGLSIETMLAGYSGTGYVTGFDEATDSLRFQFDIDETGVYELRVGYAQTTRIASYELWIDRAQVTGSLFNSGGSFAERLLTEYRLTEGPHEIIIVRAGTAVDYLKLVPITHDPPAAPATPLSDPEATPAAQALFQFLKDQYGQHILSGQQDLSEIAYVEQVTGKTPAIGAFDLIEYSPSRIEHGANPNMGSERWIDWAGTDGIVTLAWHWNAPTDLIDSQSQPWWRGFYTEATTFNFAEALADPSSERYALLLRDIDAIADQLQKFQEAEVPVLWRPLHEAAGGWFWWGAQGAEPFKELWQLLYDRLVNHHGLHNLIWVYTHEPAASTWYPGDAYVDIVSRDVYASNQTATMRGDWDELQDLYGDRMLVALSESGTLPDPDVITDFGIWWSWFVIWTGSFIHDIDPDYLRHVYLSEHVLTRDELPDWRSSTVDADPSVRLPAPGFALYPNPSAGPAILQVTVPEASDVQVEVYDITGRRVRTFAPGRRPAGAFEARIDMGDVAPGVYVVRVAAGGYTDHQTLVVAR